MEYISHEDYKKMLTGFGKEVPKAELNEGLEKEGNAFTAGLAKTKKGGEFKVGDKAVKDTSNYDSSMEEEMHSFDNIKMDTPHAHKLKVKTPNFSGTIFKNEDGTYVFYDVDNHNADPSLPPFKTITDLMKHFGINMQDLHEDEAAMAKDAAVDAKLTKIAGLYTNKAIKHAEIEKIVNALTGQGHEVNARYVQEFLKNHDVQLDEYHPDDPAGQDSAAARGEDDYEGVEEGDAEILGHVKNDVYKVRTPTGEVIDLDFELEKGDQVDDYGWEGTLYAEDDNYEYILPVALVPMGGGDWDVTPYYKEFYANPLKKKEVKEYQFDQMYPDDPGPFEGIEKKLKEFLAKEDDVNWDRVDDEEAEENQTDNGIEEYQKWVNGERVEEEDDSISSAPKDYIGTTFMNQRDLERKAPEIKIDWDMDDYHNAPIIKGRPSIMEPVIDYYEFFGQDQYNRYWTCLVDTHDEDGNIEDIERAPDYDEDEMEEGINLPSSQPTGPSIQEKRSRLAHLTSEERDQLKQYVETIKTVKEEIKKMVGKKDMDESGDNTNLIMKPTTVSEDGGSEHEEIESNLDPKVHDAFHKVAGMAVKSLMKAGIEPDQIKAFFQHEISELPDFVTRQYEE